MIQEEFPEMTIKEYCMFAYGEQYWKKGYKYLEQVEELQEHWPREALHEAVFGDNEGFSAFGGIGIRELIPIASKHPFPKQRTPERIEKFLTGEIREAVREGRAIRRKVKNIKYTKEDRQIELFHAVRLNMEGAIEAEEIQTSAEKKAYMAKPFGWVLDFLAIGTMESELTVKRTKVPEEALPNSVGRPRKTE